MTIAPGQPALAEDINASLGLRLALTGGILTGPLTLSGDATLPLQAVTLEQVNSASTGGPFLPLATGGTVTGQVTVQPPVLATTHFDAAQFITSTAQGSGVNGPQTAQIGLNINHSKPSYLTTTNIGEIDGLYITVRQGGPGSDCGGMLLDVAGTGSGFLAIDEAVVSKVDSSNTVLQSIRHQRGGINPITGEYIGELLLAQVGALSKAIKIANTPGVGASWANAIEVWNEGTECFTLSGTTGGLFTLGSIETASVLNIQGATAATSGGGAFVMWNKPGSGLSGGTFLLNQKQAGTGGFLLGEVDTSGNVTARLTIDGTGNATFGGALTVTGSVAHNNGASFGSQFGASLADLSKHIALYSTTYGLSVTNNSLNYNAPTGAAHSMNVNGVQYAAFGNFPAWLPTGIQISLGAMALFQGTAAVGANAGGYIAYNRSAGNGEMDFLCQKGGGSSGGFRFYDVTSGNVATQLASLTTTEFDVNVSTKLIGTVGFNSTAPIAKPTVSGAKGSNAALASLLTALAAYGLVTDSTSA